MTRLGIAGCGLLLLTACSRPYSSPRSAAEAYVRAVYMEGIPAAQVEFPSPTETLRAASKTRLPTPKGAMRGFKTLGVTLVGPGTSAALAPLATPWTENGQGFSAAVFADVEVEIDWQSGARETMTLSLHRLGKEWLVVRP